MTFINQMTSILTVLSFVSPEEWVFSIGIWDAFINVWTSWLMITKNRQYLEYLLCWCVYVTCFKETENISMIPTMFTEMEVKIKTELIQQTQQSGSNAVSGPEDRTL